MLLEKVWLCSILTFLTFAGILHSHACTHHPFTVKAQYNLYVNKSFANMNKV